jgi:vancomycin resistance protein YoaR
MRTIALTRSHPRPYLAQFLLVFLISAALFTAALAFFYLGFQVWYLGRIYPGVTIAGIPVGGKTPDDAAKLLTAQVTYPQTGKLLFTEGQFSRLASPSELGLVLDPFASATTAFNIGRSGSLLSRPGAQFDAWYYGVDLPPLMILDQRVSAQYMDSLSAQINRAVIEPTISIQGTDIQVTAGQSGRQMDVAITLLQISTQVQTLQDGIIPLRVHESQPLIKDVSAQAEQARAILSQPLTLTMPDPDQDVKGPWTFSQNELSTMLVFERNMVNEYTAEYRLTVRTETLQTFLLDLEPSFIRVSVNARFTFNDDTSQLDLIDHAITGRALDVDGSIQTIQAGLVEGKHAIPLVIHLSQPPVSDNATAESLGITELVIAESSYFFGSSTARIQNIQAAASKFHGVLVAPGETFSMARTLGDITLDNGFTEALIILGDRTIKGVGGGVCQVSTTLFRAAFFAGFPIVERYAHAYRVSYYEKTASGRVDPNLAGLDATVFVPLVDMKFTNDTPYWLLMETYVNPSAGRITWKFYSTKDGRSVDWTTSGPVNTIDPPKPLYKENPDLQKGEIKQVDWEAQGADISITRTVQKDGAVYFSDSFFTQYQPWQAIYEYGPGTELPPEAQN